MAEKILKKEMYNKDYHSSLLHKVKLLGVLREPIIVDFISSSRENTSYEFKAPYDKMLSVHYEDIKYASINNTYKVVSDKARKLLEDNGLEINMELQNELSNIICECIQKCESRYGNSVMDFDNVGYDARLHIYANNGKPKHVVKFANTHTLDELPKYLDSLDGEVIDGSLDNYTWHIEKDSIALDDLLDKLFCYLNVDNIQITKDKELIIYSNQIRLLKTFDVWVAGYHTPGNSSPAEYLGNFEAFTFKEACKIAIEESGCKDNYNEEKNTYYGCSLYDNESEAINNLDSEV